MNPASHSTINLFNDAYNLLTMCGLLSMNTSVDCYLQILDPLMVYPYRGTSFPPSPQPSLVHTSQIPHTILKYLHVSISCLDICFRFLRLNFFIDSIFRSHLYLGNVCNGIILLNTIYYMQIMFFLLSSATHMCVYWFMVYDVLV